jgi:DNA-directed RNA polymerase beta subunit
MIRIDKLKPFPIKTQSLMIPNLPAGDHYSLIYYPENIDFVKAYPIMGIKRMMAYQSYVLPSIYPKLMITANLIKRYKSLGLIPLRKLSGPGVRNQYIDCSPFLYALEARFKIKSYRSVIIAAKVREYLKVIQSSSQGNKRVFIYTVDLDSAISTSLFFRRIYPVVQMFREEEVFPFDYFLLCTIKTGIPTYTAFITPEKSLPFIRIFNMLKMLQSEKPGHIEDEKAETAAHRVATRLDLKDLNEPAQPEESPKPTVAGIPAQTVVKPDIEEERGIIKAAVNQYLIDRPEVRSIVSKRSITADKFIDIATVSILYSVSGNLGKAEEIVRNTKAEDRFELFNRVRRELVPDVVERSSPQTDNREFINRSVDVSGLNEDKDPSHILNKRDKDFKNSFSTDLRKTFDLLSVKKDFPLKLQSVKVEPIIPEPGDLEPTYEDKYIITLVDEKRRKHVLEIKIPTLMPDGTIINKGKKKYLIFQLILDPIYFLKKWLVKLETLYAAIAIESKQMKSKQYFTIKISGYKLPLMLLMGFYLGFHDTCKLFNIKYSIVKEEPPKEEKYLKLADGSFVQFEFQGEHCRQLLASMKEILYDFTEKNLLEKKSFEEAIMKVIGNRNCTYSINEVLSNIMEPVSMQVLKTKLLPFTLPQCILYMCQNVVTGRVDKRNDLSKQRVRTTEVFNHMIMKQILHSYNTYRFQRIAGDKDAVYKCDTDRVIAEIMNSKLIRPLENINPLEELSCLTRVTPVGPGGIPDAHAMTDEARGTDETYYGNMDPMDTPEGGNIGIINQLTVNAAITSARGSFVPDMNVDQKAGVLGTATVFTPFVNSNDGNRVMFSASQSRQSVPIVGNEPPLCQTGYESILPHLLSDSYVKKAAGRGAVVEVTENVIVIKLQNGRLQKISLEPSLLASYQGQSAINKFRSVVRPGQTVYPNQIVAEGKHIVNGTIATGTNLLVALMGWKGYQIEDGYIVSDAVIGNKIASKHYFEKTIIINKDDKVHFIASEDTDTLKGQPLLIRSSNEMEELVGLDEDEIVGGKIITKSPGGKIVSLEIYPNISIKKFPVLEEPFEKFKKRYEADKGIFPEKFTKYIDFEKTAPNAIIVVFKLEDDFISELGDKLANRHGNKGVITYIEKSENMPRTPWGEPVEIIFNPISIINRMNPGQLYELYTATIAKFAAKQLVAWGPKKTQKAIDYLSKIYKGLDNTKDKLYSSQIIRGLRGMSDRMYTEFIMDIERRNFFLPIIVPQFQTPTREMIKAVMDFVGVKNGYKLLIPELNRKTMKEVTVGWMYFNKLEQQATIKMGARSTASYQGKTLQPTEGKKREGGQRAGEMDVNSLLSHGAINVLKEFLGPLSDDQRTKNEIISEIIQYGEAAYRDPKSFPTRDLLEVYMTGLGLQG